MIPSLRIGTRSVRVRIRATLGLVVALSISTQAGALCHSDERPARQGAGQAASRHNPTICLDDATAAGVGLAGAPLTSLIGVSSRLALRHGATLLMTDVAARGISESGSGVEFRLRAVHARANGGGLTRLGNLLIGVPNVATWAAKNTAAWMGTALLLPAGSIINRSSRRYWGDAALSVPGFGLLTDFGFQWFSRRVSMLVRVRVPLAGAGKNPQGETSTTFGWVYMLGELAATLHLTSGCSLQLAARMYGLSSEFNVGIRLGLTDSLSASVGAELHFNAAREALPLAGAASLIWSPSVR